MVTVIVILIVLALRVEKTVIAVFLSPRSPLTKERSSNEHER